MNEYELIDKIDRVAKLEAALERVISLGHNLDCMFCGFKDKQALIALGRELSTAEVTEPMIKDTDDDNLCSECWERPCTDDFRLCNECEEYRLSVAGNWEAE